MYPLLTFRMATRWLDFRLWSFIRERSSRMGSKSLKVLCSASHFSMRRVSKSISSFVGVLLLPEKISSSSFLQYSVYWFLLAMTLYLSSGIDVNFKIGVRYIVALRYR